MNKSIRNIFSEVPKTYEIINHILTFGLDTLWRNRAAKMAVKAGGTHWIDVCSGTGEMAVYLSRLSQNSTSIFAVDFSLPMLKKAVAKPEGTDIKFVLADIYDLPFPDKTFDLVTISFATRNINLNRDKLIHSFKEFYRILKPGGRFLNLETSQPSLGVINKLFHLYVKLFVKQIGNFISGSKYSYAYLSRTIPRFYSAEDLKNIMIQAGFNQVDIQKLMLGVAAIHQGIKV